GRSDAAALQERLQLARTRRVAQLAQRLGLDLADALAGDREALAHLLQRVLAAVAPAEAHLDLTLLARGRGLEPRLRRCLEVDVDARFRRADHVAVLDEVPQMRVFLLADRGLER